VCENPIPLAAFPVIAILRSQTGDFHTNKRRTLQKLHHLE